jgi:aspartate/methionine/tyrosine aminotransferase
MNIPNIPLFDWLIDNLPKAKYDLANSSITGVKWSEFIDLTGFQIPDDLNLNKNDPFGAPELRRTLAEIYHCSDTQVIPATGGSEANLIVFLAMVEPGSEVIVECPGYSPLWQVPEMLGARINLWDRRFEDGFGLDIEKLKEIINKDTNLIVITNLHNPSGVLAPIDDIKAVAEIAKDKNAYLLIDEIFLDVSDTPQSSAAALENVIVTSSVSKVFGVGGFRTGWIVADDKIFDRCLKAKWQCSVAAPYFSELVNSAALSKARLKLIERCKSIAQKKMPIIKEWIELNREKLSWIPPAGGLLCFPKIASSNKMTSVEFGQKLMTEHGILISPGEYFGLDGHFRMSYMIPEKDLKYALKWITDVISQL